MSTTLMLQMFKDKLLQMFKGKTLQMFKDKLLQMFKGKPLQMFKGKTLQMFKDKPLQMFKEEETLLSKLSVQLHKWNLTDQFYKDKPMLEPSNSTVKSCQHHMKNPMEALTTKMQLCQKRTTST